MAQNVRKQMTAVVSPPTGSDDLTLRIDYQRPLRNGSPIVGALIGVGGVPPYGGYSLTGAPGWLSVDASTGILSGTPNAIGVTEVIASVTDSAAVTYTCTVSINVVSRLYVVAASPPVGEYSAVLSSVPYNYRFLIGGYTGTTEQLLWTTSGTLPTGLELRGQGDVSLGPNTTTSGAITIVGSNYRVPLTVDPGYVNGEWIEVNDFVNNWVQGQIVSGGGTAVVMLDIATARSFGTVTSIATGTTVFTSSGGTLNGIPQANGTFYFTIRVTDLDSGDYLDIPTSVEIIVAPSMDFNNTFSGIPGGGGGTFLPAITIGVFYKATVTVTGGVPPYRFYDGGFITNFPELTLDPLTGTVSGIVNDITKVTDFESPVLVEVGAVDALGVVVPVAQAGIACVQLVPSNDGTFVDNSNLKYPTQQAVKTYVDSHTASGTPAFVAFPVASGKGEDGEPGAPGGVWPASSFRTFSFSFDSGAAFLTSGIVTNIILPDFAGTICSATISTKQSDAAGSAIVDIRKSTTSTFPGTTASICASAKPTLSSANIATDSTLSGWTVQFQPGDCLYAKLDSCSGLKGVTVKLKVLKI